MSTAVEQRLVLLATVDPVRQALVRASLAWALCGLVRPAPVPALVAAAVEAAPQLLGPDHRPVDPDHPLVSTALARASDIAAEGGPLVELVPGSDGSGGPGVLPTSTLLAAGPGQRVGHRTFQAFHRHVLADELVPLGSRAADERLWYTAETILEDAVALRIRAAYVQLADIARCQGYDGEAQRWRTRMKREAPISVVELLRRGMLPAELATDPPPGRRMRLEDLRIGGDRGQGPR